MCFTCVYIPHNNPFPIRSTSCTCNCKVGEDLGSREELADAASESDGSDGDSDQELKHVLKTLGVVRVGGKWQRQEERASSTDSSGSSGESEGEDGDIDAKMDALRQGSQKVVILVYPYR